MSNAHRRELRTLTNLAERDLAALWRAVDSVDAARDGLMDILPALTVAYGSAAASLAADYYDELRDLSEARRRFLAIVAEPVEVGALEVLAGVAIGPLFGAQPDKAAALTLAQGGLQRHVANAARETVRLSSAQDPESRGWVRVGSGLCDWCNQYLTGETVGEGYDFNAHDNCGCTAEPRWT